MVNALFSSKEGGTKQFRRGDSTEFGWKAVTDLYERELLRVHNGQARMVPRLREAHCLRDSWTKLNVLPAKIMQVNLRLYLKIEMLCDLYNLVLCLCTTCLYSRSKSLVNYFGT